MLFAQGNDTLHIIVSIVAAIARIHLIADWNTILIRAFFPLLGYKMFLWHSLEFLDE